MPTLLGLLLTAVIVTGAVLVIARANRRRPRRTRVYLGADVSAAYVGQLIDVRQGLRVRVAKVHARLQAVDVEPAPPPPNMAKRGGHPREVALLRALGFDPKTHDCHPVDVPWKGIQVTRNGVKQRFFTERQVSKLGGAWKTALRKGAVA